jgi:TonB family protein
MALNAASAAEPANITPPMAVGPPHDVMTYYPDSARRLHEEGIVTLRFTITEQGAVANPTIVKSSGLNDLDNAALEAVKTWQYAPAKKDGRSVPVVTEANVRFQLTEDPAAKDVAAAGMPYTEIVMSPSDYPATALAAKEEGLVGLSIVVGEDGKVMSASVAYSSGSQALDEASEALATGRWRFSPAALNGKPTRTVIFLYLNWRLPSDQTPKP